eukprot:scaffold34578_cov89-Skeletonema_dohrnii-CCMP3373.AAC.2
MDEEDRWKGICSRQNTFCPPCIALDLDPVCAQCGATTWQSSGNSSEDQKASWTGSISMSSVLTDECIVEVDWLGMSDYRVSLKLSRMTTRLSNTPRGAVLHHCLNNVWGDVSTRRSRERSSF